jgi:NAD+ synthase
MADSYFASQPETNDIRRGNVMARLRMMVLYDKAAEIGALVLGTGNKTEILLGYTTIYGDNACSLNPIGDLYKTQVWEFSAYLDLPEEIIAKIPSADLWVGQTDEGELGVSYEIMDQILFRLVDRRDTIEEIIANGFEENMVREIVERMRRNHFKRVMPPIPKLSSRTVGGDFLYARDWGT